jgi:hypothetical protein
MTPVFYGSHRSGACRVIANLECPPYTAAFLGGQMCGIFREACFIASSLPTPKKHKR